MELGNMGNLHKKDYNKDEANSYLAKGDYSGLVNYLQQFTMDNATEQSEWDNNIKSLETKATIYNNMLKNTDDKDAITFTSGIQHGYINEDTSYGKTYSKVLNRIGSSNDKDATSLKIKFGTDDDYINFLVNAGLQEKDLLSKNVRIGQENGNRTLTVDKSNTNIPIILEGLSKIKPSRLMIGINYLGQQSSEFNPSTQMASIDLGVDSKDNIFGFNIIGLDSEGNEIKNVSIPIHKLNRLQNIVTRANSKFEQAKNGINVDFIQSELITSDFKGARHQKLINYLNEGKINPTTFNNYEKKIDEFYKNEIANAGFTRYDVYLEGKGNNFEKINNEDKEYLEKKVREAILRDDKVTYQAAMSGNMFGTLITIPAKSDTKSQSIPDQGKLKSLNTNAEYRVFIPNLFNDDAEKSFNADTQTRAIKQHHLLKVNNGTQYLSDGNIISNIDNYGGILTDVKTGIEKQISNAEVLKYLDREYLLQDAINHYGKEYNRLQEDKSLYLGEGENAIRIGNNKTSEDIGKEIAYACLSMCKELEPDENSMAYKQEVYDMYMKILTSIGYKGNLYLNLIKGNK